MVFAQILGKHPFSHASIREFEYQMKLEFSVVIKAPRQAPMIKNAYSPPLPSTTDAAAVRGFPATSETGITPLATIPISIYRRQTQSVTPVMTFTMIFEAFLIFGAKSVMM